MFYSDTYIFFQFLLWHIYVVRVLRPGGGREGGGGAGSAAAIGFDKPTDKQMEPQQKTIIIM